MKRRILVIEDDDIVRETVKFILQHKGFEIETSATGNDVFSILEAFNPHLIITDIFLGELDGRIICQEIKNNPETSHIPIIIMSGAAELYNSISGAKANDILSKPFDENTLLSRVQRQLIA